MNISNTQHLIERLHNAIGSDLRQQAHQLKLQPVQLDALVYLNQCNRFSDTLLVVAEYLGLTKGTVSKSINELQKKGLLEKLKDKMDGRVQHLQLTDQGKQLVANVLPSPLLRNYLQELTPDQVSGMDDTLLSLLRGMQVFNGKRQFGVCSGCRYHLARKGNDSWCQLTHEPLKEADWQLICREFDDQDVS